MRGVSLSDVQQTAMYSCRYNKGPGFALIMETKDNYTKGCNCNNNDYSLHMRFNQPCYGELRKYHKTHGKEYTQLPDVYRPGDLHWPFPSGKPVSVFFPLDSDSDFLEAVLSDSSPWKRGFGSRENVVLFSRNGGKSGGKVDSFYLKRCNIDPTVLVNLVWFIRNHNSYQIDTLIKAGAEMNEALAILIMHGSGNIVFHNPKFIPNPYHHNGPWSIRRFFEGKPHDLTGGTLEDRYDYNRREIQNLFSGSCYLNDGLKTIFKVDKQYKEIPYQELVEAAKEIFAKEIASEIGRAHV